ncbi:acylneuraminate cytidylyltransferase family protein [Kocuria rhizophila]|nr:acylneuraminate cytidylyltransferase family protein [Kocuria rhizophila]
MNILCVIPVRGGSEGVPRKNVHSVAGRPLVVWTIEQALAARPALDVLVSTDDRRSPTSHRPRVRTSPSCAPPSSRGRSPHRTRDPPRDRRPHRAGPDAVMLLQATSPVRQPGTLDHAVAQFAGDRRGLRWWGSFPWRRSCGSSPTRRARPTRWMRGPRRQDIGARTALRKRSLLVTHTADLQRLDNRLGGAIGLFVIAEEEGVDIDTFQDLELASGISGAGARLAEIYDPHPGGAASDGRTSTPRAGRSQTGPCGVVPPEPLREPGGGELRIGRRAVGAGAPRRC